MKKYFILTSLILLLLALIYQVKGAKTSPSTKLLIEVLSTNPSSMITFEATWLADTPERSIQFVEKTTPFTIRIEAKIMTAMFNRKSGGGTLKVNTYELDGEHQDLRTSGKGNSVVVSKRFGRHTVSAF